MNLTTWISQRLLVLLFLVFVVISLGLLAFYYLVPVEKKASSPFLFKNKSGGCFVLEEKYCQKGAPVYYKGNLIGAGFKLTKGALVFAPFDGEVSTTATANLEKDGQKYQYDGVSIYVLDDKGHAQPCVKL